MVTDILTRGYLKRPFKPVDWIHHALGLANAVGALLTLPPTSTDFALMGIQETSNIFLMLMELGFKQPIVKALFVLAFTLMRVGLGGAVALRRLAWYFKKEYPALPLASWWAQLCINSVFTVMIARKFSKTLLQAPPTALQLHAIAAPKTSLTHHNATATAKTLLKRGLGIGHGW